MFHFPFKNPHFTVWFFLLTTLKQNVLNSFGFLNLKIYYVTYSKLAPHNSNNNNGVLNLLFCLNCFLLYAKIFFLILISFKLNMPRFIYIFKNITP